MLDHLLSKLAFVYVGERDWFILWSKFQLLETSTNLIEGTVVSSYKLILFSTENAHSLWRLRMQKILEYPKLT